MSKSHEQNCRWTLQETKPTPNCSELKSTEEPWYGRCCRSHDNDLPAVTNRNSHITADCSSEVGLIWQCCFWLCFFFPLFSHAGHLVLCSSWHSSGLRKHSWECAKQVLDTLMHKHFSRDGYMVRFTTNDNQACLLAQAQACFKLSSQIHKGSPSLLAHTTLKLSKPEVISLISLRWADTRCINLDY